MEPLHEMDEHSYSSPQSKEENVCRPAKTFSFSHRRDASRQLSTRSLPSNRRPSAPLNHQSNGHSPPSNGIGGGGYGGPLSHNHNLQQSQNYHRQPSLLLLPLAAQLNPAALPISSHKQFTPNGRNLISHSISSSRSIQSQSNTAPVYTRTQSIAGLPGNGAFPHQDSAGSIASSTMPPNTPLSPLPSPLTTTTNSLAMYPLQTRLSLPAGVGHSGVESATSSSRLHGALLVSLMVLSLIGFVLTKLRDPCDDLLYVAEAESICSVTASLVFSSVLLCGSLFALLIYFLHAIGQCDYRSWNAKRQVLGEMLATGTVAIALLLSTWAVFQFTPAVHSAINFSSAICAVLSSFLLIARVTLLKREHRMLHDSPMDHRPSISNAVAQFANPTAAAIAAISTGNSTSLSPAYRKFSGSGGYVNHAASLRSSSQSAGAQSIGANRLPLEEDAIQRSSHQTMLGKTELEELRTVELDDEVFQV